MPCCHWVLSVVAASSSTTTPSWLHRLHAKGGLSFPSHLHIDDLLYGQSQPPPPPPLLALHPPPSDHHHAAVNPHEPPSRPKPPRNPYRPNPSGNPPQPQLLPPPPPPLSGVISDLFAVPSAPRSTRPALKPFRKQSRPRPRPDDKSLTPRHQDDKDKAKANARKRRRAERAADADGERRSKTEVTVIDTSSDGWKAAKLLLRRGAVWKVRDKKHLAISGPEDPSKGKRRAGLVAKIQRDKEKEKDAAVLGNIRAICGDVMKDSDDAIQTLKRPRCSDPVPECQSAAILLLPSTSTLSQP